MFIERVADCESLPRRGSKHRKGPDPGCGSDPPVPWPRAAGAGNADTTEPAEAQLARLAAAVGPLRRVLAAIAAQLTATRAFERLGYARLSDYARERPGLSARQLQELARVHRAFAELPVLERALVANALPWSKVRLVARVATAEDEAAWIARARALPTRRLEQEVRRRRAELGETDDARAERRIAVRCTPAVCEKWSLVREVAERVAGERLREGEVLELVAAEAFSAVSIDLAFAERPEPRPGWRGAEPEWERGRVCEQAPSTRACARSLPPAISRLADGLDQADAFALDRRLRRAVRLEQTLDAAIAPLLRIVRSAEHEWSHEYRPLPAYARDELGMSARKARALLRLERAGDVCPELREAYRRGRISWVKAQCLLPLLLLDLEGSWRPAWVAWAALVTVRRLAEDVERALLLRAGHPLAWQRCKFHPERAQDAIPAVERQLCAPDVDTEATRELAWRVPHEVAVLFTAVRETWRAKRTHASDGEVLDGLLDHALLAWTPARARRASARPGDRARRIPLHGARLHVAAQPARPPHRVPLRRRLRRAGESHHALRLPPPARCPRGAAADPRARARRAGVRAGPASRRAAPRPLPFGRRRAPARGVASVQQDVEQAHGRVLVGRVAVDDPELASAARSEPRSLRPGTGSRRAGGSR